MINLVIRTSVGPLPQWDTAAPGPVATHSRTAVSKSSIPTGDRDEAGGEDQGTASGQQVSKPCKDSWEAL